MAILIGVVLLLGLAWDTYRTGRRFLSRTPQPNPILARAFSPPADTVAGEADTAAEAREAELSRQLFDGRLDPAGYQRAMTELAQPGASRTGGVR